MNSNTTLGKSLSVALWVAAAGALASLTTWATGLDWGNVAWLAPVINWALVTLKNLADKNVANV